MSDVPDYFNIQQAVNTRTFSELPMNTTPMSIEQSSARPRTPAAITAARTSPYLNRISPTTAALAYASSIRRPPSRFSGAVTSPLTTPSSLRGGYPDAIVPFAPITTNPYAMQGYYQEGAVQQQPPRYTHNKRESYNSTQGTSPTLLSKQGGPIHRRESSSSPSALAEKGERNVIVRGNGFKMTKMNMSLFDSDER